MTGAEAGPSGVAERLAALHARIAAAARRAGRDPASVTLIGVSKRVAAARVAEAVAAGLGDAGESFVQEAREKIPALAARGTRPRWHLVGRLQRNKARDAARLFDWVHSVDRAELADELARRAQAEGRRLAILLQVNLSGEPQKGGATPDDLPALIAACAELPALQLRGLMTIPAAAADPEAARPVFARLRALRDGLRDAPGGAALEELSMGMSLDFEVAVEEGATMVRIGTALFGERG
jgi:pyridoxal phosphate enzyme (YggS family)